MNVAFENLRIPKDLTLNSCELPAIWRQSLVAPVDLVYRVDSRVGAAGELERSKPTIH